MGGELGRDVMKPGRSLIRIHLFGLAPAKKLRGKRGYLSTTADTKLLLATGTQRSSTKPPSYLLVHARIMPNRARQDNGLIHPLIYGGLPMIHEP